MNGCPGRAGSLEWRARSTRGWRFLVCGPIVLSLAGCGHPSASIERESKQPATGVVRSEVERGPLRVTVVAEPGTVRLSDEPTLTLTLDYETGVKVEKPPFGEGIGGFLIRDFRETLPEVRGNRERVRQIYTLEPMFTGAATIDPIVVHFVDARPTGDGQAHQLETESLTLNVISVVDKEVVSLGDLAGFDAPVALPESGHRGIWWLAGSTLVVLAAGCLWFVRRRRRKAPEPSLTPQEQAIQELETLWQSNIARSDVKQFYVELTAVVRYIESVTGIQAPEQTTEEFLREIGASDIFSDGRRLRLKEFLESADLVKFAAYSPQAKDIDESYQRARSFVQVPQQEVAA